jgi:uncharacterized membrane protein YbhN (UPF0104 family)
MVAVMTLGAALGGVALVAIAWYAGPRAVVHRFAHLDWPWVAVAAGAVVVSHIGYAFAYREIVRSERGAQMTFRRAALAVTAGFGLLTPRSGFTFDRSVWAAHGLSETESRKRVTRLAMLEYVALVPAAYAAVITLLVIHHYAREYVLVSWAIGVPAGAAAFGVIAGLRLRGRLDGRRVAFLRRAVDGFVGVLRQVRNVPGLLALLGMAAYWAADITALGACLVLVHAGLGVAALVVGYSTGYALTRRSTPMGGLGVTEALLPIALWWLGAGMASALVAVFFYRVINLWLPALGAVPALKSLQTPERRRRPRTPRKSGPARVARAGRGA